MSCCGAADVDELDVESLVEEAAQAGGVLGEHRAVHLAVGVDDLGLVFVGHGNSHFAGAGGSGCAGHAGRTSARCGVSRSARDARKQDKEWDDARELHRASSCKTSRATATKAFNAGETCARLG